MLFFCCAPLDSLQPWWTVLLPLSLPVIHFPILLLSPWCHQYVWYTQQWLVVFKVEVAACLPDTLQEHGLHLHFFLDVEVDLLWQAVAAQVCCFQSWWSQQREHQSILTSHQWHPPQDDSDALFVLLTFASFAGVSSKDEGFGLDLTVEQSTYINIEDVLPVVTGTDVW